MSRNRFAGRQEEPQIDPSTLPPRLPTARSPNSPRLPLSRWWSIAFFVLQGMSVVPALLGFCYAVYRFYAPLHLVKMEHTWMQGGRGVGIANARSTRMDWFIAGQWALACAYFTLSLTRGLLRRWLLYYSVVPSAIRVVSLQAICWSLTVATHRICTFDQPVAAWLVCATTAAICDVIQIWVTSNVATVERKDRKLYRSAQLYTLVVGAVFGPSVNSERFKRSERALSWKRVLWGTVLPFAVLGWITTSALLAQQYQARYRGGGGVDHGARLVLPFQLDGAQSRPELQGLNSRAGVRVVLLVTSSWTDRSAEMRASFRESSAKLIPADTSALSITYRFFLGSAPSPQVQTRMSTRLAAENDEHGDMLFLSGAPDTYRQLSYKVYEAWRWAARWEADFVLKTDDDIFLRMDVIAHELRQLGRRQGYWKGFAYWSIPAIRDASNKNADFSYDLALFPPYTAGALHVLSMDVVRLVATPSPTRFFVQNEDQNLGIWLYPFGIRPIHDRRIQQGHICEPDMIAKHFSSQYQEPEGTHMRDMYDNVVAGRGMCHGFMQKWCGVCYPGCHGRENHWREWGFSCHPIKGATLTDAKKASAPGGASDEQIMADVVPRTMGSVDDPWIIPGVLSRHSSVFSDTSDWHLLHMVCWTTSEDTFQERHYQMLETIWANEPRAVVIIMATMLPQTFFDTYRKNGYAVHVLKVSADLLLERQWYLGPASQQWLREWSKWSQGPNFFSHLTDYLRYLFLFKYGGQYEDMDAPFIRSPPSSELQFIGGDYSTVASDLEWTMDDSGLYLAPGVMRFKRSWIMFREIMEHAFSPTYDPECFNCVGPRAITSYARAHRRQLEQHGMTILPSNVLYPKGWQESHTFVTALEPGEAERQLRELVQSSWSVHLFGKMTNHLPIDPTSLVAHLFDVYSLKVLRRAGRLSTATKEVGWLRGIGAGLELRTPREFTLRSSEATGNLVGGAFDGIDLIIARGISIPTTRRASIRIAAVGGGRLALRSSSARLVATASSHQGELASSSSIALDIEEATLKDINAVLSSLFFYPPPATVLARRESLSITVDLVFGVEKATSTIPVVLPAQ